MKIMTVNCNVKHKSKIMLIVIRNLVFDFIFYFVTAFIKKYPIHLTSAEGTTQNTLYITCKKHPAKFVVSLEMDRGQ